MRIAVRAVTALIAAIYVAGLASICPTSPSGARRARDSSAHAGHDAQSGESRAEPRDVTGGAHSNARRDEPHDAAGGAHSREPRGEQREISGEARREASLLARCACSCDRDERAPATHGSSGSALRADSALLTPPVAIARVHPRELPLPREAPRAIDHVPLSTIPA